MLYSLAQTEIAKVISGVIQLLFIVAALASLLWLAWSGFQWVTAGGNTKKTSKARKQIAKALIGLLIVAMVWAILRWIGDNFLKIDVFTF